jgi:hypothetical protein
MASSSELSGLHVVVSLETPAPANTRNSFIRKDPLKEALALDPP